MGSHILSSIEGERSERLGYRLFFRLSIMCASATGAMASAPTPDWTSDHVRTSRSAAPTEALVFDYTDEVVSNGAPPEVRRGTATLADDFVDVYGPTGHVLEDFGLCRSLKWRAGDTTFSNKSCYAAPAFRLAELASRQMLRTVLETAAKGTTAKIASIASPYWAEQELAVQNTISDPLVASRGSGGIEWRLGKDVVVRTSAAGIAIAGSEQKAVTRYLARYVDLHPQVRQAIMAAGILPERIVIEQRNPGRAGTETITFSNPQRRRVEYPLPPHLATVLTVEAQAKTIEGRGLHQALLAVAGTANPPKPTFDSLIAGIRTTATAGRSMAAFLLLMELSQQYGGDLQSDPAKMTILHGLSPLLGPAIATPDASALNEASTLAGSDAPSPRREAAARYLASASDLDTLPFGTFRYVTFANLVRTSGDVGGWDKTISPKMPAIADCYWTHIAAYPWASSVYKDLGDFRYGQFDMARAWQAWDLGRAIDPAWRGGPMQSVAELETRIRTTVPSNF